MTYGGWGGGWGYSYAYKFKAIFDFFQKLKAWFVEKCKPKPEDEHQDPCDDIDNADAGGTLITGTEGADDIRVGDDGFTIEVGGGDDRVNGGTGDDRIIGGAGDDALAGNAGDDVVEGGDGDDFVSGGSGDDILKGGKGDDVLSGGSGDDILCGGDGDDILRAGTDTAYGGAGSDTFFYSPGVGDARIKDFDAVGSVQDKIDVTRFGEDFDTFEEVQAALTQDGDDVILMLAADRRIVIENLEVDQFSADNLVL